MFDMAKRVAPWVSLCSATEPVAALPLVDVVPPAAGPLTQKRTAATSRAAITRTRTRKTNVRVAWSSWRSTYGGAVLTAALVACAHGSPAAADRPHPARV